jgi:hypothetical protein
MPRGMLRACSGASGQAFRYLASEVLPFFVSSQSALGLPACLYKTKRVVWTLENDAKKVRKMHRFSCNLDSVICRHIKFANGRHWTIGELEPVVDGLTLAP